MSQEKSLTIAPIINYPRQAQAGKTYLMTIDLKVPDGEKWEYEEEEYPVYFMLETLPLFSNKPMGESAVVLHRYGGSYGAAMFLLKASNEEREGMIRVNLVNRWGVPIKQYKLTSVVGDPEEENTKFIKHNKTKPKKKPNIIVFRDRLKDGSEGPEMVWIPAGRFRMGDIRGTGYQNEQPVHKVSVERFAMGRYPVTVGEFRRFVEATGYKTEAEKGKGAYVWKDDKWKKVKDANWRNPYFSQDDNHPVVCVSWNDAVAYTEWLSEQTGKQYRLPTEAQWEYAARAGTETDYWWGNKIGENRANCRNSGSQWSAKQTSPVNSFEPNPFGLYDTAGNVWEWTCSEYEKKSSGKEQTCVEKRDSKSIRLSLRGGSWDDDEARMRSAFRYGWWPSLRYACVGLRVARL
jgi:formylglycine-generating enzyme required for sulfatase activity